jgi:hypothetical protein
MEAESARRWEEVEQRLVNLSRTAISVLRALPLDRDPVRTEILELLYRASGMHHRRGLRKLEPETPTTAEQ